MNDTESFERRRQALRERYLPGEPEPHGDGGTWTGGVDHLALICSDIGATIEFYTGVLHMRLTRIVPNRDDPSSTHIFLDMGGGNLLAFFDFPRHGPELTRRGVGSMHHVAMKATPEHFRAVLDALEAHRWEHSLHGTREAGSVYLRDPDGILLEVTTGY